MHAWIGENAIDHCATCIQQNLHRVAAAPAQPSEKLLYPIKRGNVSEMAGINVIIISATKIAI